MFGSIMLFLSKHRRQLDVSSVFYDFSKYSLFLVFSGFLFVYGFGLFLNIDRPFLNLSYLIVPLLCYRPLMFIVTIILLLLDIVYSVSLSGMSGIAIFGLMRQLPEAGLYGVALFSVFILIVSLVALASCYMFHKSSLVSALCAISLIVVPCYVYRLATGGYISTVGLPGVLVKRALGMEVDEFFYSRVMSFESQYTAIADGSFLKKNILPKDQKIISIVVESMGYPLNSKVRKYFEKKLYEGTDGRFSGFYKTPFSGVTINGEIRELCSQNMIGSVVQNVPQSAYCLPRVLNAEGYYTVAYHNNSGRFYDRFLWYKDIGFMHFLDGDAIKSSGGYTPSHVYAGVDDETVASHIVKDLKDKNKFFAHWITMDAHAPYANAEKLSNLNCGEFDVNDLECNYLKLIDSTVASIVLLSTQLPSAKIIVSGDHDPHFIEVARPRDIESASSHYDKYHVISFTISPLMK
jgi:hypothetical protein